MRAFWTAIAAGAIDRRSLLSAIIGGPVLFALGSASLLLSNINGAVSPVWLPNAVAVAFLLRARLANELLLLMAFVAACLAASIANQIPMHMALVYSLANLVEIVAVLMLMRSADRPQPDMTNLNDLARFIWAGALLGPMLSAIIVAPVIGVSLQSARDGMLAWFLTDSMAMVLIVPPALLLFDRLKGRLPPSSASTAESAMLLFAGMGCAAMIFSQSLYPFIFLLLPITLLHAFRLGSLGSALHVLGVAVVAAVLTLSGYGPIAASAGVRDGGILTALHLLQIFVAANFLTCLPTAAVLAGRNRMVAALEAGKRELDLLTENATDAILRYDLGGKCTYASPSVREVMGLEPDTLVGEVFGDRLHIDARDTTTRAMRRLLDGTSDKERVTYRRLLDRADGSPVFLEALGAVARDPVSGERAGVVIAARDVTERIELEQLLTRARAHAENAARAKSDFLANMSHEIRTPMNGVLGFAELLLQGELAADQRRYAELIAQSGRSMMMLLNDVLDLSKIESGQFTIQRSAVDLHACLEECTALQSAAAEQKGLTLELTRDEADEAEAGTIVAPSAWLLTDGLRLRQIVLNLLGNAVKFTHHGCVRLRYRMTQTQVRITVEDTGIGIAADRLASIFHPFTQGENDTARRFGGTGLGLSISRELASLLGGRIEVESVPGSGSRFTLILPAVLVAPASDHEEPSSFDPEFAASSIPAASRILLVEDHDINRLLVTDMLERCGQMVEVAHDGNEAIAMVVDSVLRARPYDLVLMDVQMPDCDGYAATRAIRAEGIGPEVLPIIALTANAFAEDVAAARAAGMQAHLAKPVVFAQLARALQRWLPTRIVEAGQPDPAPAGVDDAATRARSPQMVALWRERRGEMMAAVRHALGEGGALPDQDEVPAASTDAERDELAGLAHRLAGTAALFDEAELGRCAATLERALRRGDDRAVCRSLAREWLEIAEARGSPTATSGNTTGE